MAGGIQYAKSDDAHIAFEVLGDATHDVLVVMEGFIPIDTMNGERRLAASMARLQSFARVLRFDRRGIGLSDPVSPSTPPTLEQWVGDGIAVLDAAHSERATVIAGCEMSTVGLLLAAMHPDRVEALVVVNGYARAMSDVDYPWGLPPEAAQESIAAMTDIASTDTSDDLVYQLAPDAAQDPEFRAWWHETGRRGASPATARAFLRAELENDVRAALETIQVPTLVVHMRNEPLIPIALGKYVADHIPGARFVVVDGADDFWWISNHAGEVLDEIEEFVTGARRAPASNRVLSTVLFTDIVSSTEHVNALGDEAWRELLDDHDAVVRRQLQRFNGTEVNVTGDGFVAIFDGPARAVQCACAIRDATHQLGIEVRGGVHTGEIELRGNDIAGVGVHIAARVAALAEPSSVLVSRTVTDLVMGSGLEFTCLGDYELKGVPGSWPLFTVAG